MPSPRDVDRGIEFVIVALALDLVLAGAVVYASGATLPIATVNVVLLGGMLLFGALGFLRI